MLCVLKPTNEATRNKLCLKPTNEATRNKTRIDSAMTATCNPNTNTQERQEDSSRDRGSQAHTAVVQNPIDSTIDN